MIGQDKYSDLQAIQESLREIIVTDEVGMLKVTTMINSAINIIKTWPNPNNLEELQNIKQTAENNLNLSLKIADNYLNLSSEYWNNSAKFLDVISMSEESIDEFLNLGNK